MSILVSLAVAGLVVAALIGQQKKGGRGRRRPSSRRAADPVPTPASASASATDALPALPTLPSPQEESGPWPFYARRPLSQIEQVLYFRLVNALPGFVVLSQVGLSRFLGVRRGCEFSRWHNRINRMSVDYLVCTRDLSIVAVIELDDASHQRPDRQAADAKKDKALADAGLRIVRWQARVLPDEATIRATLVDARHRPTATAAEDGEPGREPDQSLGLDLAA